MAFGCLVLAACVIAGLLWQSARTHIVPYIVEVDAQGEVRGLGPVSEHTQVSDAQIAHNLERFIRDVRSLPLDPIVLKDDWLEAYDFTTARGALALNEYARVNDPFSHLGQSLGRDRRDQRRAGSPKTRSRFVGPSASIRTALLRPPSNGPRSSPWKSDRRAMKRTCAKTP